MSNDPWNMRSKSGYVEITINPYPNHMHDEVLSELEQLLKTIIEVGHA